MVAGARTFSLEETFLSPQILNPPPTRHALLAFLLALTAVLHIGTAAWGDLYDGAEGQFAAAGREMLESRQWLIPTNNGVPIKDTPPLTCWLVAVSCKVFGINATAARLPVAFAMIGLVAFTFLIGERLAGYWRGFAAGLILLCSGGAFTLGRMVTADVIFAFFLCAAIYCVVRGYQHQKFRRAWFVVFWFCAGTASLTKGLGAVLYLGAICIVLAVFFREARLRFRLLLDWTGLVLFVVITAPWFVWAWQHSAGLIFWSGRSPHFPRWQPLMLHLAWWFPALFLVLPGFVLRPRKILRPDEVTLADRLPLCWLLVGLFVELLLGEHPAAAIATLPAFALLAACAWQRTSRPLRTLGIALAVIAGGGFAALVWLRPSIAGLFSLRLLPQIVIGSLLVCAIAALILIKQRGEITLVLVLAAMIPVGCCLIEARSRIAPFFSLADAADYLNRRLGRNGDVVYEGTIRSGSSLSFYLDKKFYLVNQSSPKRFVGEPTIQRRYLDEHSLLEAWDRSDPIYLIIDDNRVAYWRRLITDRVHIYHQVTTCGSRVVLSNQM
jgi:4-amino-4-deoxy-L-arabinose transferase-like glycosyltransferase